MTAQLSSKLVQKVWSYAHVLKDDGLAFMDYTEQITYLLFLKMAWEQRTTGSSAIPRLYTWDALRSLDDDAKRLRRYHQALNRLSVQPGLIGLIFTKPQSKINDPAKLHLLIRMIDSVDWSALDIDVKGEVYEGLLSRNADDVRGGAGQYFTPRPVIRAVVEVMRPELRMQISDPACGTGGFLLGAFEYLKAKTTSAREMAHLQTRTLHGIDLVPNVARLCAMNLFLHGIGTNYNHPAIEIRDSLVSRMKPVDMVLTNPPFGKKSSFTIVGDDGKSHTDKISYERPGFWATTSNKQLNFVQHVYSMLNETGRAAVVVPDNVLFEGGAGEKIRRSILQLCNVHTLLRLPTGNWYSPSVKANVLFFEKKPITRSPATKELWVYDLRTKNFSIKRNPIRKKHLLEFVQCYNAGDITRREESDNFRCFKYADIVARDKTNLDIHWRHEEADAHKRQSPEVLMKEILSDLREAMDKFAAAEKEIAR
jgi:type I restriction enzyme M protein